MRRSVILHFCGIDWVEDHREVDATYSAVIKVDESKLYDVDLCAEHAGKKTIGELTEEFLEKYGTLTGTELFGVRPPVEGVSPYGKSECPICHETRTTRVGAINHVVKIHSVDKIEASRMIPPAGESIECEVCGYLAQMGQGYGAHVRSEHGAKIWERVRKNLAAAR